MDAHCRGRLLEGSISSFAGSISNVDERELYKPPLQALPLLVPPTWLLLADSYPIPMEGLTWKDLPDSNLISQLILSLASFLQSSSLPYWLDPWVVLTRCGEAGSGRTCAALMVAGTQIHSLKFLTRWLVKHKVGCGKTYCSSLYVKKYLSLSFYNRLSLQQGLVVGLIC